MDNSPLRFLDLDVAILLTEQVRISQEEESRRYHFNLFMFRGKNLHANVLKKKINQVFAGFSRYWGDFWDKELTGKKNIKNECCAVGRRIIIYEHESKNRKYLKPNF